MSIGFKKKGAARMELYGRDVLEGFKAKHGPARAPLERWERLAQSARWRNFVDLRRTMAGADQVKLSRALVVTVFNVGGNKYRVISEVVYAAGIVRALKVLTHAEYDKGRWKEEIR
jgi:mRNA interferase HigB